MAKSEQDQRGALYELLERLGRLLPKPDKYPEITRIVESLHENTARMSGMGFLPSYLVAQSVTMQRIINGSAYEASHHRTINFEELTQAEWHLFHRIYQRRVAEHQADTAKPSLTAKRRTTLILESLIGMMEGAPQSGFEAFVSGIITNAWTTFEVVSTDLWEEAVNARPDPLALTAIAKSTQSADGDDPDSKARQSKINLLQSLIKYEPDAIAKAATVLRRVKKFDFTSYAGIRDAYDGTFAGEAIKKIFRGSMFSDMIVLEGARHVLVHRAGRADRRYLERVRANKAQYQSFGLDTVALNERLPLNGIIARRFAESSVRCCSALVKHVGTYLANYQEKTHGAGTGP